MEIRAQLNYLRISPRKVRVVSDLIDGLDYIDAKYQLDHLAKRSSRPISKLLDSAAANAKNLYGLAEDNLYIKKIVVNEGPTLKRYKPKGFGSAMPIAKRSSHVTVILEEKIPDIKAKPYKAPSSAEDKEVKAGAEGATKASHTDNSTDSKASEHKRTEKEFRSASQTDKYELKKKIGKKEGSFRGIKKFFRRKSI